MASTWCSSCSTCPPSHVDADDACAPSVLPAYRVGGKQRSGMPSVARVIRDKTILSYLIGRVDWCVKMGPISRQASSHLCVCRVGTPESDQRSTVLYCNTFPISPIFTQNPLHDFPPSLRHAVFCKTRYSTHSLRTDRRASRRDTRDSANPRESQHGTVRATTRPPSLTPRWAAA